MPRSPGMSFNVRTEKKFLSTRYSIFPHASLTSAKRSCLRACLCTALEAESSPLPIAPEFCWWWPALEDVFPDFSSFERLFEALEPALATRSGGRKSVRRPPEGVCARAPGTSSKFGDDVVPANCPDPAPGFPPPGGFAIICEVTGSKKLFLDPLLSALPPHAAGGAAAIVPALDGGLPPSFRFLARDAMKLSYPPPGSYASSTKYFGITRATSLTRNSALSPEMR
mmetsp:Transcript_10303/g.25279  ORF Transcript_10303/g.25279 Transcript_10303/m.25279 type:complete len:226 (+) Transcript_10303:6487-7164(+)